MSYTVKNVKSFQGREGDGFKCSLYLDGKKIGTVIDTADGGMVDFYLDNGEKEKLDAHCLTLPKVKSKYFLNGLTVDADIFVSELVSKYEVKQKIKRWCKTKTVFRLDDDKEDSYNVLKIPFSDKVKEHILKEYAGKNPIIMNEII